MKICVIMSTYNGEKYLKEQLDSIFGQNITDEMMLFVRDDSSVDSTVSLLENYKNENRVNIQIYHNGNLGSADSFMDAVRKCPEADYYAFCDQDDVWHKDKLRISVSEIGVTQTPVLWCSNYSVVDESLNCIVEKAVEKPRLNDLQALFYNNIPGCVMVFNRALLEEVRKLQIEHVRMHDIVTLNIALISGKVIFNPEPFILYRQHSSNVIGYGNKKIKLSKMIRKNVLLLRHGEKYSMAEYAQQILMNFSEKLSDKQINEYRLISLTKDSFLSRIKLLGRNYTKLKLGKTSRSVRWKLFWGIM